MRRLSFLYYVLAALLLSSCGQSFKKGDKGLEYKIISGGKGKKITYGKFIHMHFTQYYSTNRKDSLLLDTRKGYPNNAPVDSMAFPPEILKVLLMAKEGDSLVLRIPTDTIMKRYEGRTPPFMKKGNYYKITIKILKMYNTMEDSEQALKKIMEEVNATQLKVDEAILQNYFRKNNINPVKAPKGTYVLINKPGDGAKIDTNVIVKAYYKGMFLDGKQFDTNTNDTAGGKGKPLAVNMTNEYGLGINVIPGWEDGFSLLSKGASARFFIPSGLAYGPMGSGGSIPPNAVLIFDVDIVDVVSKEAMKAEMDAERKKREEEMKKAAPNAEEAPKMKPAGKN